MKAATDVDARITSQMRSWACAQALRALGQLPKQARAVSALQQELAGALPIYHPLGPEQELAALPLPYNPPSNPTPTANP